MFWLCCVLPCLLSGRSLPLTLLANSFFFVASNLLQQSLSRSRSSAPMAIAHVNIVFGFYLCALRTAIWSTTDLGHFLPGIMLIDFLHESFVFLSTFLRASSSNVCARTRPFVPIATIFAREFDGVGLPKKNRWMDYALPGNGITFCTCRVKALRRVRIQRESNSEWFIDRKTANFDRVYRHWNAFEARVRDKMASMSVRGQNHMHAMNVQCVRSVTRPR